MANRNNALLEYESLFRQKSGKKMSNVCFQYNEEQNEKTAIMIFKYAFENILGWTPTDVINNLNEDIIRKMHLSVPYAKLRYPRELKKNRDYFYVAKIVYPDKVHSFTERDIILYLYKAVLGSKDGKFPKEYFVEQGGDLRAKVCMQYILSTKVFFKNKEELYEFFSNETRSAEFLKEYHLTGAKSILFETSLDYAHASLPLSQRDEFLYCFYTFLKHYQKSAAKKKEPEWELIEKDNMLLELLNSFNKAYKNSEIRKCEPKWEFS